MAAELEVTHNDIYRDVRALLLDLFQLPSENVIRGYSNNVPLPNGDFILMNIINETDLSTNGWFYLKEANKVEALQSVEVLLQIDFYGKESAKNARIFSNLWRDFYSSERLKVCQPLYCNNPKYLPFTNEQNQYEERYMVEAYLTYIPVATYDQDYVDNVGEINLNKL